MYFTLYFYEVANAIYYCNIIIISLFSSWP